MKALALVSGGLDSLLAARLVQAQGIEIIGLYFAIPFCSRASGFAYTCPDSVRKTAEYLKVELKIVDIRQDLLSVVQKPAHGYGKNVNPCIDCKILMLRKAKEYLGSLQAAFVITGEVVGQRPMSQYKRALALIDTESGLSGLIVRPLSARILPKTEPEKNGWISRSQLLGFNGRSRRPQIELARQFGYQEYAPPAGGCLLTDKQFGLRIRDLLQHGEFTLSEVSLLKVGRHFRISGHTKLVVARDKKEGEQLLGFAEKGDYIFLPPEEVAGATALGRGFFDEVLLRRAGSIIGRYYDLNGNTHADIVYSVFPQEETRVLTIPLMREEELHALRI